MISTVHTVIQQRHFLEAPVFTALTDDLVLCNPSCETCGGIGYVRWDVPIDHPSFGKLARCPNTNPKKRDPGFLRRYGLSPDEIKMDWNSIIPVRDSNIAEVVTQVKEVFERGYGWIYLWGTFGIGKTLIQKITVAASIRAGKEAVYIRMAEIMDMLRDGYQADNFSDRMETLQKFPVLCIDEFDRVAEKKTDGISWVSEKRFTLMDVRYVSAGRGETLTIMTGNKNPAQLVFDDGYLSDRIHDHRFLVLEVTGESLRPGMEWNK
jgi:DNA replication protein DnaC